MLYPNVLEQGSYNQEQIYFGKYTGETQKVKELVDNILPLHSKTDRITYNLSQIGINVTPRDIETETTLLSDDDIKEKYLPNESNIHIAPMLSTQALFDMVGLNKNSLKFKKVTDIGGGFTALPFELQDIVHSLEIVDPCFDGNIKSLIAADISLLEKMLISSREAVEKNDMQIKRLNKELEEFMDDYSPKGKSISMGLMKEIEKTKKYKQISENSLHSKLLVINELKIWKELTETRKSISNNLGFQNVHLNSSVGENIKGITNESQDVVFVNHLLTKENVNPYLILSEAVRITKKGGEIIVVNDAKNGENDFSDLLENTSIEINHDKDKHKIWFRVIKN